MARHSCCAKQKLRKGLWSPEEDEKLYNYITRFGVGCWSSVPKLAGLQRCGKSCRLRWINYLRPDLKRGMFSQEEEDLIIHLHKILGNRWAQIASQLPGRTDNEIKNFWNSCLKKKLMKQGIDPQTHQPIITQSQNFSSSNNNSNNYYEHQQFKTPTVTQPIFQEVPENNTTSPLKMHQPFAVSYQSILRDIISPNQYLQTSMSVSELPSLENLERENCGILSSECFSQSIMFSTESKECSTSSSNTIINNNSSINSNSNTIAGFPWDNSDDHSKYELGFFEQSGNYGMIKIEGSSSWGEEQLKSISLSDDLTAATDDGSFDVFLQHM
ncbi:hypothetical protein Cgig2_004122 [Carnegiea gigantea]|uniref:Uncharacterized protein n=1 Tax=Carnegiea gigantea TaxID=171969 RepID=A0A9Q1QNS8_9CARY|nr:hypothetical protein Cgig2_004122 [Carnegiea gigantea]